MAEVQLHPNEIGERDSVDDDLRRFDDTAVTQVPLEPEQDVVPAPRTVFSVVAERHAQSRWLCASDDVRGLDYGGRLLELLGNLADGLLGEHP